MATPLRQRLRRARSVVGLRGASMWSGLRGARVVHMLHVGKTGGTAVKAALEKAEIPNGLRLLLHPHGVSLRDVPAGDEVFFFLRDPLARFVSGYESRRREGRPAHYRPWTPAEKRAFEQFPTVESLALGLGSADRAERADAEIAIASIVHVRSHMADWLISEEILRQRLDKIILVGWQERLEPDFARLVELLGLPAGTRLPSDEAAAHRAPREDARAELSERAATIVRARLEMDYRLIHLLQELGFSRGP